jgi:hypothetical protein
VEGVCGDKRDPGVGAGWFMARLADLRNAEWDNADQCELC